MVIHLLGIISTGTTVPICSSTECTNPVDNQCKAYPVTASAADQNKWYGTSARVYSSSSFMIMCVLSISSAKWVSGACPSGTIGNTLYQT